MLPHFDVSASWMASSFGDSAFGSRREMVLIVVNVSFARRVVSIWLPTAPVHPKSVADAMAEDI